MTTRLLLRAALRARPMAHVINRAYLASSVKRTYLPSLTSTIPQLRTFSVAMPRFSNGEGKVIQSLLSSVVEPTYIL